MNWKKAIGFGVLFWVLMFAIISVFVGFKIYDYWWLKLLGAIIAGVISFVLAGYLKLEKYQTALLYGIIWVVIGLILDAIVSRRFNAAIFTQVDLWLGYVLVFLAPCLRVKKVVSTGVNVPPTSP